VETALANNAGVIGMSALLTTTMGVMKKVTDIIEKEKLSDRIKVIIGGAPVTKEYADQIGADEYGYDAAQAVETIKSLSGKS
jgi:5-methyltetrahydrofolate--homocysteine methyltransferase